MDRKLHLLDTFSAKGADGRVYKVKAYEQLARDPSVADGQDRWEPTGVAELHLDSGELSTCDRMAACAWWPPAWSWCGTESRLAIVLHRSSRQIHDLSRS
jgi:hypothetical protein